MNTRPEPRCNGGECDKRETCKHAIVSVWDDHKIYSVEAGDFCGFYVEHKTSEEPKDLKPYKC